MDNKRNVIISFIVVTVCFALWGFANDVTNPMVKAFSKTFRMSVTDGALVQVAFYGGYFALALPAAVFIRRHSYKSGILIGLGLFALGSFLFFPAALSGFYYPFLAAYFVMTCGLSVLETSANPYILTMGDPKRAAFRLNLAQSFNPIGSLFGMFVAMHFVQERLSPLSADERALLPDAEFEALKAIDLAILSRPYLVLGTVVLIILLIIFLLPMHTEEKADGKNFNLRRTIRRIIGTRGYKSGFVAQFFYVGAQIMCWTFIIQYGTEIFMREGLTEQESEVLSQKYNIAAMVLFCAFRFICTALMKYIGAAKQLTFMALMGAVLTLGVIFSMGVGGMYFLVAVSACMSLMFPTIYSISLRNLDVEDAKIGAAGQIMAILGGSLLPAVQAMVIDNGEVAGLSSVNASFVVPLASFVVVAIFALNTIRIMKNEPQAQ